MEELLGHCLFINLDSRPDRYQHVSAELAKLGLTGERVAAVKPASGDGALGCTLSHIKCLEMAKSRAYPRVFICEDDIEFLDPDLLRTQLAKFWSGPPPPQRQTEQKPGWDVLIIGGNNCPPYQTWSDYAIKVQNCQTTTGYVVGQHYYDILIQVFRESARNLIRFPQQRAQFALDIYWKRLQQTADSRWFMIVPATVTQYSNYSDIERKNTDYTWLMTDLDKKWLNLRR